MKAKIVNRLSDNYSAIIDVKLLNHDYIFGVFENSNDKAKVPFEDIEFIYGNEFEKKIVKYRDLLKISLPEAATVRFYGVLCSVLEDYFKGEIQSICIIRDVNEKARKGYWYKRIEIIINETHPASITVSGENYTDQFNINVEDIDVMNFICGCREGISKLRNVISRNIEQLVIYEKALRGITNPQGSFNPKRAIEGR